jgi:hypothetical protein
MMRPTAEEGPTTWTAPCPGCGSALIVEDGSSEVIHEDCAGCGRRLIRVWTDTVFVITFSEWAGQESGRSARSAKLPRRQH